MTLVGFEVHPRCKGHKFLDEGWTTVLINPEHIAAVAARISDTPCVAITLTGNVEILVKGRLADIHRKLKYVEA